MNRRQRLLATLKGLSVDRPAVSFYEIGGFKIDPNDTDEFNVYNDPSWQPLLDLANSHTDIIRMVSPVRAQSHESWESTNSAPTVAHQFIKVQDQTDEAGRHITTTVNVAGRTLTSRQIRKRDADTVWTTEHLLKNNDDVKAYLQLPDEVFVENIDIDSLIQEELSLGDSGIVMVDTEDPICVVATLFSMQDYTVFALTEQKLCHALLEKCARYIHKRTENVARNFPGRLWRIYGPEFACPPYLPPNLFDEYVVTYTKPIIDSIKKYGGFARLHAHGRIADTIDSIAAMGADAIDPIEPAPQGDVDLRDIRKRYGDQFVLFGNIEVADIDQMNEQDFTALVKKTLADGTSGTGKGFVLMPTASPCGRIITETTMRNYRIMVNAVNNFNA
ncbi:MAG: hypothetical protein KAS23_14435 [Anaerohalosphaera sp.]|nr:hypothetical protein [Anaerohalosphaera sp.]